MREMKNAIGYIRVSTGQQAKDDRYGVESQRNGILNYADKEGYCIVDWKIDEISGVKDDRPAFNQILDGNIVTNPPIEAVIVFKNDRVARETKLYFYYLYVLEKRNIKLLSAQEDFGELGEFAGVYRSLLMFVAEQERKNIAIRTGRGRSMKAQCGGYSGGRAPFGYMVEHGKLVINDEEKEVVEYVFQEKGKNVPMLRIAEALNLGGYKTRSGGQFYTSNIKSIIENEKFYRGMYRYGQSKTWVQGVHEPILKEDE